MTKTKILYISSTAPLPNQTSGEIPSIKTFKAIEKIINLSKYGHHFEIIPEYDLEPAYIQEAIMHHSPDIIHYFGHGAKGCLYFQNEDGSLEATKLGPFVDMFQIFNEYQRRSGGKEIKLVILVACNSDSIAKAVSKNVYCTIGVSNEMPIEAGIAFSEEFYAHLCEERDVKCAYSFASNAPKLMNLNADEKPKIFPEDRDFSTFAFKHRNTASGKVTKKWKDLFPIRYGKLDFPINVYEGVPITVTGTLRNEGNRPITLNGLAIAVRPPHGMPTGGPFTFDFTLKPGCIVNPGETVSFSDTKAIEVSLKDRSIKNKIKDQDIDEEWYGFIACQTDDGVWHNDTSKYPFVVRRKSA